jgi:hypothetical protein
MDDRTSETLQLQKCQDDEAYARDYILGGQDLLHLDNDTIPWILNHTDCFVNQCRVNESVKRVELCPHAFNGHDDGIGDKVGQAIGNLQSLELLHISTYDFASDSSDEDEDTVVPPLPVPDWEILARILSHVRQRITLTVTPHVSAWRAENSRSFPRAIHGHPTITSFEGGGMYPYESLRTLYSALATLPALESVSFRSPEEIHADESALAYPESLTELLRVPSLRSVCFECFDFTTALCEALVNALIEGTAVTKLRFSECFFPDGECAAILANGLSRNTSVSHIEVVSSDL